MMFISLYVPRERYVEEAYQNILFGTPSYFNTYDDHNYQIEILC